MYNRGRKKKISNKKYAVLGLGRFGIEMAKSLSELGCEVFAVDKKEDNLRALDGIATHMATANVANEGVLTEFDIQEFDAVVVAIGDLSSSIMTTQLCKDLGAKYVIAKANDEVHAKILEKVGADKIVFPEVYTAQRMATVLFNPNINELIEMEDGYSIAQVNLPKSWEGKDVVTLDIRKQYALNILFVIGLDGVSLPSQGRHFVEGDKIVIGGLNDAVTDFLTKEISE